MKKLFFTICALCLCGTMWADYDETTGLYYSVEDEAATITVTEGSAYTLSCLVLNDDGSYSLPATLGGYPVVDVADYAFQNDFQDTTNPIHLVIPANVNRLGQLSFGSCTQIEEVTLEYSSTSLTEGANSNWQNSFYGCSGIKTVNVNRNVTATRGNDSYHTGMFSYQTSIVTINIGENVTSFVHYMFSSPSGESSLSKVYCYIDTPITLATGVFENINSTAVLYVHPYSVDAYKASDWADIFSDIQAMEEEQEEQPEGTLMDVTTGLFFEINEETGIVSIIADQESGAYYDANLVPYSYDTENNVTAYTLPDYVEDKSGEGGYVTRIEESAFAHSAVSGHIVIPAFITQMGASAFDSSTGITEVTYEYSATALTEENNGNGSGGSFTGCSGIKTVNMYRNITWGEGSTRQNGPFQGLSSITTVNIGPRVTRIPSYIFRNGSYKNGITAINVYSVNPPVLDTAPFNNLDTYTVSVPQGSSDTYKSDSYWSPYVTSTNSSDSYGDCTLAELTNAYAVNIHNVDADNQGYATFYDSKAVKLYGDVVAYTVSGVEVDEDTNNAYVLMEELGDVIPAGTGALLAGDVAYYTAIEETAVSSETYSGTDYLLGFDEDGQTTVAPNNGSTDDYYFYMLTLDSANDEGSLAFYWGADGGGTFTCSAHKAYLALEKEAVGTNNIKLKKDGNGGDETTGISSVEVENEANTVKGIYTLQGVRVSDMSQKGVYIVDGKKVLVK